MNYLYRVPRWLALGIVCLGGAVLFGGQQVMDAWRESQWGAAQGQVVATHEETRPCGRNECVYQVAEYRFTVGTTTYSGQSETSGRESRPVVGASVPVRYDPSNPAQSVVDAPSVGGHALGLGIALGVAAIGVLCLLKAVR